MMDRSEQRPRDALIGQASMWFARMTADDVDPGDVEAFEAWLNASSEHVEAYLKIDTTWVLADVDRSTAEAAIGTEADVSEPPVVPRRRTSRRWALAASLLVAVMAGGAFLFFEAPSPEHFTTLAEETRTVVLEDGSIIDLNARSSIIVELTGDRRQVVLEQGEAFFAVASDPSRPFSVRLDQRTIRVVGTKFNLQTYAGNSLVSVIEGVVEIDQPSAKPLKLSAGQQVSYGPTSPNGQVENFDALNMMSWRTGWMVFDATPLEEIVEGLNRYYETRYAIGDPSIASLPFTGAFRFETPDKLIAALEGAFAIKAVLDAEGTIVLMPDPVSN